MGRVYKAPIDIAAATGQVDIVEITAATEKPIAIHEVLITTDIEGDANEVQMKLKESRFSGAFTGGSVPTNGTADVPAIPIVQGDAADGATIDVGNTTQTSGGSEEILSEPYMNNRVGLHLIFTPETRPTVAGTDAYVIGLQAAPASNTAFAGHIVFEELI